jgi:hypothetical protein
MARAEFDKLPSQERIAYTKDGGQIV